MKGQVDERPSSEQPKLNHISTIYLFKSSYSKYKDLINTTTTYNKPWLDNPNPCIPSNIYDT